jgi:hypothetical protein
VKKGYSSVVVGVIAIAAIVALLPSPAVAQSSGSDVPERRRNIRYMEGVLAQAVRVGAEQVGKELERIEPNAVSALLGTPRARGFLIDGHGVFFDVEVPDMDQSIVASLVMSQREQLIGNAADSLRDALRAMPEGQTMQQVQAALRFLTGTGAAKEQAQAAPPVTTPSGSLPGQVVSPPVILTNPRKVYRAAVIDSVVDAMLGYSVQMNIGSEEWLTVAARGVEQSGPLQGLQETTTITVRVKGSDLAIYHSDPARRAEIREKVKADAKVF